MLIKSKQFDDILQRELYQITINKNYPPRIFGSYKIKRYGSVITDIDMSQHILPEPSLIIRLSQILDNIERRGLFVFIHMVCGTYDDFVLPWKIEGEKGECEYDPQKTKKWFDVLVSKKIVDEEIIQQIREKLFSDVMTVKNLLDVKQILRPFSEILWNKQEIKRGYKIQYGKKYEFLELILKGSITILKFLYRYGDDFCDIDCTLVDTRHRPEKHILSEYYDQNIYKIFKSMKWYIKREYFSEFLNVVDEIEVLASLLSRVKMIQMISPAKILSQREFDKLIDDTRRQAKKIGIDYSLEKTDDVKKAVITLIHSHVQNYIKYFRTKVYDNYKSLLEIYDIRAEQSRKPLTQQELQKRFDKGNKCPFFTMKMSHLYYIYNLAQKTLLEPKLLINCFEMVSQKFDIDMDILITTVFSQNKLSIVERENELILYDEEKEIERYPKSDLQKLQIRILT